MEQYSNWPEIRTHFSQAFNSSLHVSIASVDNNNQPTVTPIGSLFLNKDQTGFYFEMFSTKLPKHVDSNNKICILGVNSSKWFWAKSLFRFRFKSYPAVKLYGTLGKKRAATEKEIHALKRRMRFTKKLKGHQYLWGDMNFIREIKIDRVEKINLGKMTAHL